MYGDQQGDLKGFGGHCSGGGGLLPAAEAATAEEFAGRLQQYGDHFWLLWEGERLLAFVDGLQNKKSRKPKLPGIFWR